MAPAGAKSHVTNVMSMTAKATFFTMLPVLCVRICS